jgi:nucleotide-binding universal stress UspA family protein
MNTTQVSKEGRTARKGQPAEGARRIVVGVDGSPESLEALKWAGEEARTRGAILHAVRIWHYPASAYGHNSSEAFQEMQSEEEEKLSFDIYETLGDANSIDVYALALDGIATATLAEAAEGAELLVVGSRGHHGIVGALAGSVSDRIPHRANCPVVVVPQSGSGI